MIQRVLLIFWEFLPLGFIEVNFDGSIRDGKGSVSYVIRGLDARLLAAFSLFESSISSAELRAI